MQGGFGRAGGTQSLCSGSSAGGAVTQSESHCAGEPLAAKALRWSYFIWMNSLSSGLCSSPSFGVGRLFMSAASQNPFASAFPHRSMLSTQSSFQSSACTDFMRVRCVPRLRWIPEHGEQMKVPRLIEAHAS